MVFILLFSASFIVIKPLYRTNSGDDCQEIIDSATVFINTNEYAINTKPTIRDRQRNLKLDNWLRTLSFKKLLCLLDNESVSLKVLGFVYAANSNGDSLMKSYSYLLTDTTTVQFIATDGNASPKMKLGELLSTMTQKIKDDKDNFSKRPEIENLVSKFIKQYSTYPDTYKPISFPYFSVSSGNEGISGFNIRHEYEIKNNEAKTERVVNAFVLDRSLRINVIEKDSSSYISSYPPKLEYWLKEFARKLTKADSAALRVR